ncbi:MAG: AAA family ATPase [Chloroflexi bacterium]|nr:AAA family ATPase [Chloroflexota bacterium]
MKSIDEIAREAGFERDELAATEPQVATATNGDISVTFPDRFIRFTAQAIDRRTREFNVVLTIQFKPDPNRPARRLLADTRVNLMSQSAKEGLARSLAKRRDEEWPALIEDFSAAVQDNWSPGDPAVVLTTVTDPGPTQYLVSPLLQLDEHTVIFGQGGGGKSVTGLAIAIAYAVGRSIIPGLDVQGSGGTLYLDWERSALAHRRRAASMLAVMGRSDCPNLHYRRMHGLLADSADDIKRYCGLHGIGLIVTDSVGMACGGEINEEAAVLGYFNAARVIGGTWLSIAHVAKAESNGKPIGSQYWYTQPQGGTYEMLGESTEGESTLHLTMIHQKTNDHRNPTMAWAVDFANGQIVYRRADPVDATTDTRKLPIAMRIADVLGSDGALTAAEIAERTGTPVQQITTALNRGTKRFVKVGGGRPQRWGLMAPNNHDNYHDLSDSNGGVITQPPKGAGVITTYTLNNQGEREKPRLPYKDDDDGPEEILPWDNLRGEMTL